MDHFFLSPSAINGNAVFFPEDVSSQIAHVLRLRARDVVLVLDNLGSAYEVALETVTSKMTVGRVVRSFPAANEPVTHLQLQICLTQREKFEWILQKGTELGISEFMPILTSRTLLQKEGTVLAKYDRWRRILKEAAEQCERGRIPELLAPLKLNQALPAAPGTLSIVLNEGEFYLDLKRVLRQNQSETSFRLLVGPEGGFNREEIEIAEAAGYQSVTLGPRILRMETAAISAAAIVMYEFGEMGRKSD